ncbi:hypothetical protein GCM10011503_00010 [Henriciella pelagia]|uniref:Tyr recombinase domain-containing protein n=1 Tax=Henriciella pelagia TaxID=1977912 RepID=A0ABQ1J1U3_9PROT|nr:hypothetical protein GCM10011503_00010 [Henriciella pelagia]
MAIFKRGPDHSFYSLRHSFEDRMIAAGVDDRIRRDLFGHRLDRERYGKGASLEHVAGLVESLAQIKEDFPRQQLVAKLGVEALAVSVFPW